MERKQLAGDQGGAQLIAQCLLRPAVACAVPLPSRAVDDVGAAASKTLGQRENDRRVHESQVVRRAEVAENDAH